MTINDFAKELCELETGKEEVNIAQVKEILKLINMMLNEELYKLIKKRES